jgi:hypothetical protein
MRANKIMDYHSMLQVLSEPGCPFCRFMKNYQAALLQEPADKEVHHLCSFHTWGLAATQRATSAASLLSTLLASSIGPEIGPPCDLCTLLQMEEDRRIREFVSLINHKLVAQWFRETPILCVPHGTKLKLALPQTSALRVASILEAYRTNLVNELERLQQQLNPDAAKWGVLGHAAEFLISQRGLRR